MATSDAGDDTRGMNSKTLRIGGLVTAAMVLLVVVAMALGGGGVRSYPTGSPEAALQAFLQALLDDDVEEATKSLSPDALERCDDRQLRWNPIGWHDSAQITTADIEGATAELTVVVAAQSGPFGDPYESEYEFGMEQIDGDWLIADLDGRFFC